MPSLSRSYRLSWAAGLFLLIAGVCLLFVASLWAVSLHVSFESSDEARFQSHVGTELWIRYALPALLLLLVGCIALRGGQGRLGAVTSLLVAGGACALVLR